MSGPQGFLHLMKSLLLLNADAISVVGSHLNNFSSEFRSQPLNSQPYPT